MTTKKKTTEETNSEKVEDQDSVASEALDAVRPDPSEPFELVSGRLVKVERVRLRQLIKFVKILSAGTATALQNLQIDPDENPDAFLGSLLMALVVSVPEGEGEIVEFIQSLVIPADLTEGRNLPKSVRDENDEKVEDLFFDLYNPDLDDVYEILSRVFEIEGPHLLDLANKVTHLIQTMK